MRQKNRALFPGHTSVQSAAREKDVLPSNGEKEPPLEKILAREESRKESSESVAAAKGKDMNAPGESLGFSRALRKSHVKHERHGQLARIFRVMGVPREEVCSPRSTPLPRQEWVGPTVER